MYVIAVFSNRRDTLNFNSSLKRYGINSMVISTPKGLGSSCSVAVKFYYKAINRAIYVLKNGNYASFTHFFKILSFGNMCKYEIISF